MAGRKTVATRTVTWEMQEGFAELSGDRNPMHMDAVLARRTYAGQPVVHGIHTLLWALESLLEQGLISSRPTRIKGKFIKWIYPGSEAVLTLPADAQTDPAVFHVEVQGLLIMSAELFYGEPLEPKPDVGYDITLEPLSEPRDLSFAQMADRTGEAFVCAAEAAAAAFPALARACGARLVAEMASTSYVVGMEAPGLHSTFSKIDLTLRNDPERLGRGLDFQVIYHDERFRKARVRVQGATLDGVLEVFVRSAPAVQASMQEVAAKVTPGEFAGMTALVIGGSRGLGEVIAKIVASGGGRALISYAVGKTEAERLAAEIHAAGGQAEILSYDVRQPPAPQIAGLPSVPTHLFFFATNIIGQPRYEAFSAEVFAEFVRFYIRGFYDLCVALLARQPGLRAYYPSSVFVEERPQGMAEYSMAKAAGEILCAEMNRNLPGFNAGFTRLPRLPTDQTAGVLPARVVSPMDILLPLVRERMGA